MKAFSKVCISISLVTILLGAVLIAVGFSKNGELESFRIPFYRQDIDKNNLNYQYEEKFIDIKSLDLNIEDAALEIERGEEFCVKAYNFGDEALDCYVKAETDTLIVKYKTEKNFNFFWKTVIRDYPRIVITIPVNFQAKDFKINMGAGEVIFYEINTINADLNIGAGSLQGDILNVKEKAKINIGSGSMEVDNVTMNNITAHCGTSKVDLQGVITGDNIIDCGVGNVSLSLPGSWHDYNYDMNCGIGNISINKEDNSDSLEITAGTKKIENSAKNSFKLKCGLGNIDLDFGM